MAGAVISRGLMFAASVLVARMLGKTGFGELGIIQSTVGMFGVFAGFGLGLTATKHVAEFRSSNPERTGRIIGLSGLTATATGGLMALGLCVSAPWLAEHTINAPHLAGVLRISAVMLFVSALNGAQTGALSGFEAFKTIAYVNLFVGLLSFPILIGGAYFGGLTGAVWAIIINLCINWLLNHFALRKEICLYNVPFTLKNCSRELSILWRFSLPAVLSSFVLTPVTWLCNAILVNQPTGYAEMGIYNASYQWHILLMFIPSLILQTVLPVMSETNSRDELNHAFKKTLDTTQSTIVALVIPFGTALMFLSDALMLLYGGEFRAGSTVLIGIVSGTLISSIGAATGPVLQAKGRIWIGVLFNLTYGAILLAIVIICSKRWGASSIAFGSAFSYLVLTLWAFVYMRNDLPEGMLKRVIISILFAVCITCVCLYLTPIQRYYWAAPMFISALVFVFFTSARHARDTQSSENA
jgi:O-antigen/teichoic acid export membrane protein